MKYKMAESCKRQYRERGATLFMVAAALIVIVGLAGLAIDLVALYLGRSEAQRSADAAALAGAKTFVTSGFTSGSITSSAVQPLATNQAITVGQQNLVNGAAPSIPAGNITFDFSHVGDPMITVVVNATQPTYFMQIFGVSSANVSATATAEAYSPSGTPGPTLCQSCLKPFLVPNCDPVHTSPASPVCTGQAVFIKPDGTIGNPGPVASGGVVGQTWLLHSNGQAPSHWYEVAFNGDQSGSSFADDVRACNTSQLNCGTQLMVLDGKKVGPTNHAINDLIHASRDGLDHGQDSIDTSGTTLPFPITGGANNPNPALVGQLITQSDSVMTVPVYDPASLVGPGNNTFVPIVGYLQVFVQFANHQGNDDQIQVVILNVAGCGTIGGPPCGTGGGGGSGSGGTVSGGGSGFLPIRLVHP
jgi:hypothetical protein